MRMAGFKAIWKWGQNSIPLPSGGPLRCMALMHHGMVCIDDTRMRSYQ